MTTKGKLMPNENEKVSDLESDCKSIVISLAGSEAEDDGSSVKSSGMKPSVLRSIVILLFVQFVHQMIQSSTTTTEYNKTLDIARQYGMQSVVTSEKSQTKLLPKVDVKGYGVMVKALAAILTGTPAGYLSDRIGRRPMILVSLAFSLIWLLICWKSETQWGWYIGESFHGIALYQGAVYISMIVELVPPKVIPAYIAYIFAARGIGFSAGTVMGKWLNGMGDNYYLVGMTIFTWLAMIGIFMVPESKKKKAAAKTEKPGQGKKVAHAGYLTIFLLMICQMCIKSTWDFKDRTVENWTEHNYPETFNFTDNSTPEKRQMIEDSKTLTSMYLSYGAMVGVFANILLAYTVNPEVFPFPTCGPVLNLKSQIGGQPHMMTAVGIVMITLGAFFTMMKTSVAMSMWIFPLIFSVGLTICLTFINTVASKVAGDHKATVLSIVDIGRNLSGMFSVKIALGLANNGLVSVNAYIALATGCVAFVCILAIWNKYNQLHSKQEKEPGAA